MKLLVAVTLTAVVAVAVGLPPQPCTGPTKFTAKYKRMDPAKNYFAAGTIYFDSENKQVRQIEDPAYHSDQKHYDILRVYGQNKEYRVDLSTKVCTVAVPSIPFYTYDIPSTCNFTGHHMLGVTSGVDGKMNHLNVTTWEGLDQGKYPQFFQTTSKDCIPIIWSIYLPDHGFYLSQFSDIKLNITKQDVFTIPTVCSHL